MANAPVKAIAMIQASCLGKKVADERQVVFGSRPHVGFEYAKVLRRVLESVSERGPPVRAHFYERHAADDGHPYRSVHL